MDSTATTASYSLSLDVMPQITVPQAPRSPAAVALRRTAIVLSALLCVVLFFVFAAASMVAYAISHPPVAALASNPLLARNLAYDDVVFPSSDGNSQVDGWWIPAAGASGRTVVLSHGYGTNREESWVPMYDIASLLHGLSYNVLMFDYGYADAKHKLPATGGVTESKQLIGALQYARSQGSTELIVWGFSMGAGSALQAALQTDLINGMILDSTFIPDAESLEYNIRHYVNLPGMLSVGLISRLIPMFSGTQLDEIPSAEAQSTDYHVPVMIIYGTADDKSPASISENVAAAQTNPLSQLWIVPDAIHEMIFRTHPEEYVRRTTAFLQDVDASMAVSAGSSLTAAA